METEIKNENKAVSIKTKLLQKRRNLYQAYEDLEKQKNIYKATDKTLKNKENIIRNEDSKIQDKLIENVKILQDSEKKKIEANIRIKEEQENIKTKIVKLKELEKELENQENISKRIKERAKYLKKYEKYLNLVVENNKDHYSEYSEIINRYKVLECNIGTLKKKSIEYNIQIKDIRKEHDKFEKQSNSNILILNNKINKLQKENEEIENKKNYKKSDLDSKLKKNYDENILIGKIFMAIENINQRSQEINQNFTVKVDIKRDEEYNNDNLFKIDKMIKKLNYILNSIKDIKLYYRQEKKLK